MRGLRALDLVGALLALWRAERRGARENGFYWDWRSIHDSHHLQRVQQGQGKARMDTKISQSTVVERPGTARAPRKDRILLESCRRRCSGGLRNVILVFRPPW